MGDLELLYQMAGADFENFEFFVLFLAPRKMPFRKDIKKSSRFFEKDDCGYNRRTLLRF